MLIAFAGLIFPLFFSIPIVNSGGLGCFVCTSINGSEPSCEDAFNTSTPKQANFYHEKCFGYRRERNGYFPADHCIKIDGVTEKEGRQYSIMIRTCSVDSGALTADSEIVRMSHCGHFTYENGYYSGCVQSCKTDGCNSAAKPHFPFLRPFLYTLLPLLFYIKRGL